MPEILLILAIALIVIGPKKLPDLAKTLGRAMGEFKRSAQDFKRSLDVETTVKDIKDINLPKTDLKDILKDANKKDAAASEAENDTGSQDSVKDAQDNKTEKTQDDKGPATSDNPSDHDKNNI